MFKIQLLFLQNVIGQKFPLEWQGKIFNILKNLNKLWDGLNCTWEFWK